MPPISLRASVNVSLFQGGRAKVMIIDTNISRRSVLAGLSGMSFCIALGNDGVRLMSQAQANALANAPVTPWVRIAADGKITILSAGAEMGQGSMTSLPLILAEEMDADGSNVAIEWTPADASIYGYKDPFGTEQLMWIVGSRAVQLYFTQLRTAGAQVRKVLIANAAQKWRRRRNAQDRAECGRQSRQWSPSELRRDRRVRHDSPD